MTRDVDITLITGFGDEASYVTRLLESVQLMHAHWQRFDSRLGAEGFARRTRVVLLQAATGVAVDVALGALPFEERGRGRSPPGSR